MTSPTSVPLDLLCSSSAYLNTYRSLSLSSSPSFHCTWLLGLPTKHNELIMKIPHMVISDERGSRWIRNSSTQTILHSHHFSLSTLLDVLTAGKSPTTRCAVVKTPGVGVNNDCTFLTAAETAQFITAKFEEAAPAAAASAPLYLLQQYIPNPTMYRVVWHESSFSSAGHVYVVSPSDGGAYAGGVAGQVWKRSGRKIEDLLNKNQLLAKYLEAKTGWRFKQLVCDYMRDESEHYVFIQVKGFLLHDKRKKGKYIAPTLISTGRCSCCQRVLPQDQVQWKLTKQMRNTMKRHLETHCHGAAATHLLSLLSVPPPPSPSPCCLPCSQLHLSIQALQSKARELNGMLGSVIQEGDDGYREAPNETVPNNAAHSHDTHSSQPPTSPHAASHQRVHESHPNPSSEKVEHISLPSSSLVPPLLHSCRLFFYVQNISFPAQAAAHVPRSHSGVVHFKILERDVGIEFNMKNVETHSELKEDDDNQHHVIPLNRVCMLYFFATPEMYAKFLERKLTVSLFLRSHNSTAPLLRAAGQFELDLSQFSNPLVYAHTYRSMFTGQNTGEVISCTMSVGAVCGPSLSPALLHLEPHASVFIPKPQLYTCEPIPQEWIDIMKKKDKKHPHSTSNDDDDLAFQKLLSAESSSPPKSYLLPSSPSPLNTSADYSNDEFDTDSLTSPTSSTSPSKQLRPSSAHAVRPASHTDPVHTLSTPSFMPVVPPPPFLDAPPPKVLTVAIHCLYHVTFPFHVDVTLFGRLYTFPGAPLKVHGGGKVGVVEKEQSIEITKDMEDQLPNALHFQIRELVSSSSVDSTMSRRRSLRRNSSEVTSHLVFYCHVPVHSLWITQSEDELQQERVIGGMHDLVPTYARRTQESEEKEEKPYLTLTIKYQ